MKLHREVLDQLDKFPFSFVRITGHFNSNVNFRRAAFKMEYFQHHEANVVMTFHDIYNFPVSYLEEPNSRPENMREDFDRLIRTIKRKDYFDPMTEERTFPRPRSTRVLKEEEVMGNVVTDLLIPLFGKVDMEYKSFNRDLAKKVQGVQARHIGIGTKYTLHGTPDSRVSVCDIVYTSHEVLEGSHDTLEGGLDETPADALEGDGGLDQAPAGGGGDGSSSEEPPAASARSSVQSTDSDVEDHEVTYLEGKIKISSADFNQLVATAITASFTMVNVAKQKLALLGPWNVTRKGTILINSTHFRICIYDCEKDILLLSHSIRYYRVDKHAFLRSGTLLLWIAAHDRYAHLGWQPMSCTNTYKGIIQHVGTKCL